MNSSSNATNTLNQSRQVSFSSSNFSSLISLGEFSESSAYESLDAFDSKITPRKLLQTGIMNS